MSEPIYRFTTAGMDPQRSQALITEAYRRGVIDEEELQFLTHEPDMLTPEGVTRTLQLMSRVGIIRKVG